MWEYVGYAQQIHVCAIYVMPYTLHPPFYASSHHTGSCTSVISDKPDASLQRNIQDSNNQKGQQPSTYGSACSPVSRVYRYSFSWVKLRRPRKRLF